MKQLYIIGIAVAVLLLVLLALNKLGQTSGKVDTDVDVEPPVATEETPVEKTDITNVTEETMNDEIAEVATAPRGNTTVVMKTNKGDITIELFTSDMPITAGNFLKLAQSDYYDGIKFHRIIDGFMIQGGDPLTKDDAQSARWGSGGPGYSIADEFGPRYGNDRGTLSMANAGPNTGGSQFFINTVNNNFLDGKHPVFGKVVAGMDVVDAISATPTGVRDVPTTPVVIEDIVIQ
jgi:peptidylprolyl isomerase